MAPGKSSLHASGEGDCVIALGHDRGIGIQDRNIRPETIKLLEANIGKTLTDINNSRILYDPPHRVMDINEQDQII